MLHTIFPPFRSKPFSRVLDDSHAFWSTVDDFRALANGLADMSSYSARIKADETDAAYTFTIALPGFKREDVSVEVAEDTYLTVRAAKAGAQGVWTQSNPNVVDSTNCRSRTITLPSDADPTKVEAKLEDGLLSIEVGKLAAAKPRKVTVT